MYHRYTIQGNFTNKIRKYISHCVHVFSRVPLCDPMDCGPQSSSVHGISQARMLELAAISSPGDLPDPGSKPTSPVLAGGFCATWEVPLLVIVISHY